MIVRGVAGFALVCSMTIPVFAASPPASISPPTPISAPAALPLQPHRIAYEIKLGAKKGSSFSDANGLIALEFTGNACKGFSTHFRQATRLSDPDGAEKTLDFSINHWEGSKGDKFHFKIRNKVDGQIVRDDDGEAKRVADGSVSVSLKRPKGKRGDIDGAINFPTAMLRGLLAAAQRGDHHFDVRLFDGSEGGEKIYETVSTIGKPLEGERNSRIETVLKVPGLEGVSRWPVSTAYFETTTGDRTPVYTLKNVTFANGVVSDLTFNFPDFSLTARAVRYEPLPTEACP